MVISSVMKTLMIATGAVCITSFATKANAASLVIPSQNVLANSNYTPDSLVHLTLRSAPSFTVSENFLPSDTLSLTAEGTVDLAPPPHTTGGLVVNAAGVTVSRTFIGNNPGEVIPISTVSPNPGAKGLTIPLGSLAIGNTSLGFFKLFPANSANGLGNSTPPTTLSLLNVPLSSIFTSSGFSGLSKGTKLEFRVTDTDDVPGLPTSIDTGTFRVTSPAAPTSVPEPTSSLDLLAFGAFGVASLLTRKRKDSGSRLRQ